MSLHIIFPMGGTGQRFVKAGYTVPKPLLMLGEKRLIDLAIESIAPLDGSLHFLPTLDLALREGFVTSLPPGCIHIVLEPTLGPLQTVLEAKGCLSPTEEVLFCDCDSTLAANELTEALKVFRASGAIGGVTVRRTTDPTCSFATLDAEWWVQETREKDPFSSWSTTGPYWFKTGEAFLHAMQKAVNAHHTSLSPVYNYLAGRTKAVPISTFRHFGTPEAYEAAIEQLAQVHA